MVSSFSSGCLPNLSMLQMTHNHLTTREDVEHLAECPKLSSVDLSHNRISDETVIEVFPRMKALRVLVLTGGCFLFVRYYLSWGVRML